jgi:hypothetical protein
MKSTTKLWYGLGVTVARAGAAAVAGTALLPAAFAGPAGEAGEGGEGAQPAAHGQPAGEGGEAGYSAFPGNLDKAVSNIFAGEGGEGGAGLSLMWPSITIPALSSADIKKVVSGNTLRTDGHVAWYFTPDQRIEGGFVEWKPTEQQSCPATDIATDAFYRGTDGVCYTYKLYESKGSWAVRDNQLCLDVSWSTGAKNDCRYVAILLEDIALFDAKGKIDGKGMKLLKGKQIAE